MKLVLAALFLAATLSQSAHGQVSASVIPATQLIKTTNAVAAKAAAGTSQRLIVLLDGASVLERERLNRRTLESQIGPNSPNELSTLQQQEGISSATRQEIAALHREVFDAGPLKSIRVLKRYENAPAALVLVDSTATLAALVAHPKVVSVSEDVLGRKTGTNNLALIGQPNAFNNNRKGANTRVAVADTGINFYQRFWATNNQYPACRYDFEANGGAPVGSSICRFSNAINFGDGAGSYFCGGNGTCVFSDHGESVAGIVLLVAPAAKIAALQTWDANGSAYLSYMMSALDWVASNANFSPKIASVVIATAYSQPISGTCPSDPLAPYITRLVNMNVVVAVASGNDASSSGLDSPACVPGATAVGAVYDTPSSVQQSYSYCSDASAVVDKVACFSNSSSNVTLLAPGVNITVPNTFYAFTETGTSQAAPHVAGAVAVLRGDNAFPGESNAQTLNRLISTGVPVTDARNGITKPRIQLDAALGLTVGSISISPANPTLTVGSPSQLTATINNAFGNPLPSPPAVTWSSSNPSVATVDGSGNVTPQAVGTASITASAGGKSGSTTVTVTNGHVGIGPPNCRTQPWLCG